MEDFLREIKSCAQEFKNFRGELIIIDDELKARCLYFQEGLGEPIKPAKKAG